jgi:hypothetical protein
VLRADRHQPENFSLVKQSGQFLHARCRLGKGRLGNQGADTRPEGECVFKKFSSVHGIPPGIFLTRHHGAGRSARQERGKEPRKM